MASTRIIKLFRKLVFIAGVLILAAFFVLPLFQPLDSHESVASETEMLNHVYRKHTGILSREMSKSADDDAMRLEDRGATNHMGGPSAAQSSNEKIEWAGNNYYDVQVNDTDDYEQYAAQFVLDQADKVDWEPNEKDAQPKSISPKQHEAPAALPLTETYERRLRLLADQCEKVRSSGHGVVNQTTLIDDMSDSNVYVNDRLRFIYCLVPKVACTTWTRVLLIASGNYRGVRPNDLEQFRVNAERLSGHGIRRLDAYNSKEIEFRLKYYFKFMFVRHPFERLVSGFRDRLHSKHKMARQLIGKKIVQRYRQKTANNGKTRNRSGKNSPTFDEFVQYLVDPRTASEGPFNAHWRPEYELCKPCSLVNYDFVGHFETLKKDADFVLRSILGPDYASTVKFPSTDRDNPAKGRSSSSILMTQLFHGIPEENVRKLKEIYRMDFGLFGYE